MILHVLRRASASPKLALIFAATTVMAGCSAIRVEPQELSPADSAAAFADRRLTPSVSRWTENALVREALAGHPEVVLAVAKAKTAQAAVRTANAKPNPTVAFTPDIAANAGGAISPWTLGFSLDVPIETAGKRSRRIDAAHAAAQSAALDAATISFRTASGVRHFFRSLAAAESRVELLNRQQAAQEEVVGMFEVRVRAGEIARAETAQSRLLLQQTRLAVRDAEKKLAETQAALADAAGFPAEAVRRASFDYSACSGSPTIPSARDARRHAMQNRTDLLSALADYAGAEAALQLEIAKQYPDIHLSPGYQYDQGTHKWSLPGISAALPVFDRNQGPIGEAVAKRAEAAAAFEALQAKVSGEIDHAFASFKGAQARLAEADRLVVEQRRQEASLAAQQTAGAVDRLTVASATVELRAAELAHVEALADLHQVALDLDLAAQIP